MSADPNASKTALGKILIAVGLGGAALAALCCFAPFLVGGLLTAIGVGFILMDSVLMGLVIVSLGIAALGYYTLHRRRHG
jgi:hypothetical protein